MGNVIVKNVNKFFDDVRAVNNASFTANEGEFVVIVGPSGCGKTTTLRMVAGLEDISNGEIYIDDLLVNDLPPRERSIAMVFQNYALYPHLSVYENIAFGLKIKKAHPEEIKKRVREVSENLEIRDLLDRKPKQLSGGEQQRVAMGRAIVRKPKVFLFDEPLSNLDAKLRVQMRLEIKKLHEGLKTTIIYVTHDQIEAMTLADKIIIMNQGKVMQIGSPRDVYEYPHNLFVAGFIGSPSMNLLPSVIEDQNGKLFLNGKSFKLLLPEKYKTKCNKMINREVILGIRPDFLDDSSYTNNIHNFGLIKGITEVCEYLGSETVVIIKSGRHHITAKLEGRKSYESHCKIELKLDMDKLHIFDKKSGESLDSDP
jgi:multiple sugar transport system ATP-binding protein